MSDVSLEPWYDELDRLMALEDGFDGEGALAPRPLAGYSMRLLRPLVESRWGRSDGSISPDGEGGLDLEYREPSLYVSCMSDGFAFVGWDEGDDQFDLFVNLERYLQSSGRSEEHTSELQSRQ